MSASAPDPDRVTVEPLVTDWSSPAIAVGVLFCARQVFAPMSDQGLPAVGVSPLLSHAVRYRRWPWFASSLA